MKKKAEGFSDHIAPVWHHSSAWAAGDPQTRQLWPLAVTETEYDDSHWWELRNIPFLALELVLQGELTAEIDHRKFNLRPGDLLILNHPGRKTQHLPQIRPAASRHHAGHRARRFFPRPFRHDQTA